MLATSVSASCLCCIQDGMDQAKFRLPRIREQPSKLWSQLYRPRLHVAGCWIHGKRLYFGIAPEDLPKDSVCQIEQLARALNALREEHGALPLGLAVQQDNTYREGKNRHYLAFIILAVSLKMFRWAVASYLRVGHSHSVAISQEKRNKSR